MKTAKLKAFYSFIIVGILFCCACYQAFAMENITPEEKTAFKLGSSYGNTSYYMSDLLLNPSVMGAHNFDEKYKDLEKRLKEQTILEMRFDLSPQTEALSKKIAMLVDKAYEDNKFDQKTLKKANELFKEYSDLTRSDILKVYGPKHLWLLETGYVSAFMNASMNSPYKNKLIMMEHKYLLNHIPYDLPTSILNSLKSLLDIKPNDMTNLKVQFLKEESGNILAYFENPSTYTPPTTLKNIVGIWEGRLSDPYGIYHKASFKINPDLSATITAEGLFEKMPVPSISLAGTTIGFDVNLYGEEKLAIKFSGKVTDEMMTGEAVDVTGKKGLWQFLRVQDFHQTPSIAKNIQNDPSVLATLSGVWKGKILEENGAISHSTLIFSLQNPTKLLIETSNGAKELEVKNLAANENGIKFNITLNQENNTTITFTGSLNKNSIEGNAIADDGSRAFWKLLKIKENLPQKSSIQYFSDPIALEHLCDPILDNMATIKTFTLATLQHTETFYQGFIYFPDHSKNRVEIVINSNDGQIKVFNADNEVDTILPIMDFSQNGENITFKTSVKTTNQNIISFDGTLEESYIKATAKNFLGNTIKIEAFSQINNQNPLALISQAEKEKLKENWEGHLTYSTLFQIPAKLTIDENTSTLQIGENLPIKLFGVALEGKQLRFIAQNPSNNTEKFMFSGLIEAQNITGRLKNLSGLEVQLELAPTKKNNQAITNTVPVETISNNVSERLIHKLNQTLKEEKTAAPLSTTLLSGKWTGTLTSPTGEPGSITLLFEENKSQLIIENPNNATSFDIEDLSIDNKLLTFVIYPLASQKYPIVFRGKLKDGILSGIAIDPSEKEGSWNLKKAEN